MSGKFEKHEAKAREISLNFMQTAAEYFSFGYFSVKYFKSVSISGPEVIKLFFQAQLS